MNDSNTKLDRCILLGQQDGLGQFKCPIRYDKITVKLQLNGVLRIDGRRNRGGACTMEDPSPPHTHTHTRIQWSINFSLQNNLVLGGGCKNPKTG